MGRQGQRWPVWILLLGLSVSVSGITRQELFPFGRNAGDQSLHEGNDQTHEITLDKPITFYDGQFNKIYINTNGFVALEQPTEETEYLGNMPASFGMIAALQGDLDTSDGVGKVFFRQDSSPAFLQQAANHINRAFPEEDVVNPVHAVVVTWVDVASHQSESRGDGLEHTGRVQRNTFQLVIASLETMSYAILLYPRDTMQFQSTGSGYTMHVGFSKGQETYLDFSKKQGPYYRITAPKASIKNLAKQTNSGKRGVWVYEIGAFPDFKGHKNHIHQHPVSPDIQHKTDGIPQKMHGKVSGRVFVGNSLVSVDFGSNYLHSYVGVNGSTLYVAIRGIPLIVGFSLQPLIGEIIGVKFKRQANVTFQPGGERLTIILKFKGIDEHGHLMVDIRLKGKIAEVPQRAKVCIQPYTKIYNYSINLIISSSTRVYVISLLDD